MVSSHSGDPMMLTLFVVLLMGLWDWEWGLRRPGTIC
jgi:hypothetical protein